MQLEFVHADEIMLARAFDLLRVVIRVIDLDFIPVRLFEVEVDKHLFDELRVQIVVDHLCLSDDGPRYLVALPFDLFVQNAKWIRLRKGVHIGQLFAFQAQFELLSQACLSTDVRRSKNSSIDIASSAIIRAHLDGSMI